MEVVEVVHIDEGCVETVTVGIGLGGGAPVVVVVVVVVVVEVDGRTVFESAGGMDGTNGAGNVVSVEILDG